MNKGEARNALARAVFFRRLGEIRGCGFEQQRYRTNGLNLVTAAIVLWNTVSGAGSECPMNTFLERVYDLCADVKGLRRCKSSP